MRNSPICLAHYSTSIHKNAPLSSHLHRTRRTCRIQCGGVVSRLCSASNAFHCVYLKCLVFAKNERRQKNSDILKIKFSFICLEGKSRKALVNANSTRRTTCLSFLPASAFSICFHTHHATLVKRLRSQTDAFTATLKSNAELLCFYLPLRLKRY